MNQHKQVLKAISAFVAAEQATSTEEGLKQVSKFEKAQKKLAKAHQ